MRFVRAGSARNAVAVWVAVMICALVVVATGAGKANADPGWTPVDTLRPTHVTSANAQLVMYGVHAFTPNNVAFDYDVPANGRTLLPYVRVPDGDPHTYRFRFHVDTNAPTTTQYRLTNTYGYDSTVTVPGGAAVVEFVSTLDLTGTGWVYHVLQNASGDDWVFTHCEIDEQTG